jgi:acyl dehydratase
MQGLGETIVGLVGLECRFKKATRIGDTLHVRLTVAELKPTSKGGRGIVVLNRDAVNQRDEVVLESVWSLMIRCRLAGAST